MSAKRQASSNLNHDNWDQDDEPEERGTFQTAPEDELNRRVIKKARRKITGTSSDVAESGNAAKSVFSGFAGFGKPAATFSSSSASPFSFLSSATTSSKVGASETVTISTTSKPTFSFSATPAPKTTDNIDGGTTPTATTTKKDQASYFAKLKGLNQAVSDWIKSHVDTNPLCILTPIFRDYEKYLKELKDDKIDSSLNAMEATGNETNSAATPKSNTISHFKFTTTTSNETTKNPPNSFFGSTAKPIETEKTNGFNFMSQTSAAAPAAFMFGKTTNTAASSASTTPIPKFSFGNVKPPPVEISSETVNEKENDDEDDEPPKVEFKQVVEDDAIYSKKCKVFVKKDGNFVDRGVGTLFLKPVQDSKRTQLLVRADTNLGNILVNLLLNAATPTQRMGKNNVMLVCLPLPNAEKPTPMLLRVKTSEEADELLKTIDKYKK